ncbi:hypothetical protein F442_07213 [Phytophthora nicotianae P10297]|uniref:RxLR effector protein n=1 Tax=Phytophthora nicotianae P10297 TaxID=1317064 RepID=W2ZHM1_PHYNI|nr:hypothetical protein F442_07213 [Phytophthora nicotianae P10297]
MLASCEATLSTLVSGGPETLILNKTSNTASLTTGDKRLLRDSDGGDEDEDKERAFNPTQEAGFTYLIRKFRSFEGKADDVIDRKINKAARSVGKDPQTLKKMYEMFLNDEKKLRAQLERQASLRNQRGQNLH